MFDPKDLESAAVYRRAYGEAARLVEIGGSTTASAGTSPRGSAAAWTRSLPRSAAGWARAPIPGSSKPPCTTLSPAGNRAGDIELMVPCDSVPVAHRRLSDMLEAYSRPRRTSSRIDSITVVVLTGWLRLTKTGTAANRAEARCRSMISRG